MQVLINDNNKASLPEGRFITSQINNSLSLVYYFRHHFITIYFYAFFNIFVSMFPGPVLWLSVPVFSLLACYINICIFFPIILPLLSSTNYLLLIWFKLANIAMTYIEFVINKYLILIRLFKEKLMVGGTRNSIKFTWEIIPVSLKYKSCSF